MMPTSPGPGVLSGDARAAGTVLRRPHGGQPDQNNSRLGEIAEPGPTPHREAGRSHRARQGTSDDPGVPAMAGGMLSQAGPGRAASVPGAPARAVVTAVSARYGISWSPDGRRGAGGAMRGLALGSCPAAAAGAAAAWAAFGLRVDKLDTQLNRVAKKLRDRRADQLLAWGQGRHGGRRSRRARHPGPQRARRFRPRLRHRPGDHDLGPRDGGGRPEPVEG